MRIAVVGACASGKTTLVSALRGAGFDARHVAQDHSFVRDMWQRVSQPDVLIYLEVDYSTILSRRPRTTLSESDYHEQLRRLSHAREHCDLHLDTNRMPPEEILQEVLAFLEAG